MNVKHRRRIGFSGTTQPETEQENKEEKQSGKHKYQLGGAHVNSVTMSPRI
jgi:hypothetical protein